MTRSQERVPFDLEAYKDRVHGGPCFICALQEGLADYHEHVLFEDESAIVFLNRYPTLLGSCLVAPRRHLVDVVTDFDENEYLVLQRLVYRVGRAVAQVVPTERLYVLSLGSRSGNAHVHWHVAPLPPGVPYEQQQHYALMAEHGVVDVSDDRQAALAAAISQRIAVDASA
ncbi:HIT family protein [Kineosporia sp. A_224]|uniref:HIT family protein n=1 Tax=Kineosporia sp. A_224 TaxID=1962180 RepID=UPI000B4BA0A2|nr:HIT family protein [Kineosporia sp. A_224]